MLGPLTIAATLLPVAYYIFVGVRPTSRPRDLDDYFIYDRNVTAKDFATTAVGYSLQMAAVFLFADWGMRYGFGAFWTPLFWALGFLFLYLLVPKLDRFESGDWTLHGYLNNVFRSRLLQTIAAIATIIGLWGTMMVEIDYTTTIYQPFFGTELGLYSLGLLFLTFGFIYIAYGGYKAEVNTERVQVPTAYTAFLLVTLLLVLNVFYKGQLQAFWVLNAILFVLFVLMIVAKSRIIPGRPLADRQIFIPIIGIGVQLIFVGFASLGVTPPSSFSAPSIVAGLPTQLGAQGFISILSLFFANSLWQFVDISSWQRVSSIQLDTQDRNRYAPLRRGIWRVMIESPVSWGFGVVFGMALRYSGLLGPNDDPSVGISNFVTALTSGQHVFPFLGQFSWLVYPVFCAAAVAIMLSTVDALLSAITFTAFHDLPPYESTRTIRKARFYTLGICVIGAVVYFSLRYAVGVGIQSALYTFYSSQLTLFPAVIASFFEKRPSGVAAIASILAGVVMTFASAVVLAQVAPDLGLVPPLFALVTSAVVYAVIAPLTKPSKKTA